jgi:hypothetical protein
MSRKEEILHKLNTEDRNYIKKKFKEREEFCIGQVESLTNLINVLIEENKELVDENFKLETKLTEKEKYIEEQEFAEYKEMFYATQALKEDCELKIIRLEKQLTEKDIEIERFELSLKRACEAVFDEEIPYDEIQEMKRKHNRYTVGIVLEDVLFYYKKLAEEELKDV